MSVQLLSDGRVPATFDISVSGAAIDGQFPACPAQESTKGIIQTLELVRAEAVPEAQGIYRTVVDAYQIRDKKRECGVRLSLRSLKEALNAPSGA